MFDVRESRRFHVIPSSRRCASRSPRRRRNYHYGFPLVAALVALAACGSSSSPKPKISFNPGSITLTATAGSSASGSVAVNNGGGGSLNGLGATIAARTQTARRDGLTATLASSPGAHLAQLGVANAALTSGTYSSGGECERRRPASPPTAGLTVTPEGHPISELGTG